MNTALSTYLFNDVPIRSLLRDGDPWFVSVDVCRVLDIQNPRDAVASLDEADVATTDVSSESGNGVIQGRTANIVNESGLYQLIFTSRKPEAKAFKRWVTREVLPAIRKTGRYAAPGAGEEYRIQMAQLLGQMSSVLDASYKAKIRDSRALTMAIHETRVLLEAVHGPVQHEARP